MANPSKLSETANVPAKRSLLRDATAYAVTFGLLALCTWGILALRGMVGDQRPYTILYLIPVAIGAALLNRRGGLLAAATALILARIFLLNGERHGAELLWSVPTLAQDIEFASLLAGAITVALVTGRLRTASWQAGRAAERLTRANGELARVNIRLAETNSRLEAVNFRLQESEQERRVFYRDVLQAVTGGKLRLVEPDEMPPPDLASGPPTLVLPLEEPFDATALRQTLQTLACDMGMDEERIFDLCTSATEAGTNAIKHGHGGEASIWKEPEAVVVAIADRGEGIAPTQLARATLEQGYSTRVSLGMGFHLMLQTSDVLALSTTPQGTTVLFRVSLHATQSEQDTLLSRYIGL